MQIVLMQRRAEYERAPDARSQRDLAFALNGLGMAQAEAGNAAGAKQYWRECLALLEALATPGPADRALTEQLHQALDASPKL
jgi:hypothetical protein